MFLMAFIIWKLFGLAEYHKTKSRHSRVAKRKNRITAFTRTHLYKISDMIYTGNTVMTRWTVVRVG